MNAQLLTLLHNAKIDISGFGMHRRTEMLIEDRVLPYYVMSYHKSGKALMRIRCNEYHITPGQVILLPPHVSHDHIVEKGVDTELFWWHFTFTIGGVVDILRLFTLPYVSEVENRSAFESVFENYCTHNQSNPTISNILHEKAKSFEILAILFEAILTVRSYNALSVPENFLKMLREVLEYPTADFSLNYLAERYYLNATYISNRFKEYFGISPINLHRQLLVSRAKGYLEAGKIGINELAELMGFESSQSFSRFFTSKTGLSPSQYRATFKISAQNI